MAENEITKKFWGGVQIVGAVVVGTVFVQNKIEDTIKETLMPLTKRLEVVEIKMESVKETQAVQTYKIQSVENTFKEFLKPSEVEFKTRKK